MSAGVIAASYVANPIPGVNIGDSFMGGYLAGFIDTTKGNIIAADASQTGAFYALIVSPKSLENASLAYKNVSGDAPTASLTRWDGLSATLAMASTTYPAANWCYSRTYSADGASRWYLPAMDELEVVYRNLKATTESNYVYTNSTTFPGSQPVGYNPSSKPPKPAYLSGDPAGTAISAFQSGGSQALGVSGTVVGYWSSTNANPNNGYYQSMSGSNAGLQFDTGKTTLNLVRPVRRFIL